MISVASFTKEVNPRLAKCPLKTNGHLANLGNECFYPAGQVDYLAVPLQWCHNGHGGISNHQPHYCLLNHLFRRKSKKTSRPLCAGNSLVTGAFPAQMASNAEKVSIWWCHHGTTLGSRAAVPKSSSSYMTRKSFDWNMKVHFCLRGKLIISFNPCTMMYEKNH